jgi:hypothetical protein
MPLPADAELPALADGCAAERWGPRRLAEDGGAVPNKHELQVLEAVSVFKSGSPLSISQI